MDQKSEPDLDLLFGTAIRPVRVDPLESVMEPRSVRKLDTASAEHLRHLMDITTAGFGITRYVYSELPILWLVDGRGDLWFCVEEIVDPLTRRFIWPRLRRAPVGTSYERLGHPSLVQGGAGRIGGELLFDLASSPPAWFLTNASGRYGLRPGRKPEHLSNACKRFAEHGITLQEFFTPPL